MSFGVTRNYPIYQWRAHGKVMGLQTLQSVPLVFNFFYTIQKGDNVYEKTFMFIKS